MLIDTPPRMHGGCCVSPIWVDHFEILSSRRQFLLRWLSFAAEVEVTIQKNTRLGSINSKCIPIVSSWSICLIEPTVHISDYSFCLDTFIWDWNIRDGFWKIVVSHANKSFVKTWISKSIHVFLCLLAIL